MAMRLHDERVNDGRDLSKPRSSALETDRWKVESDNVSQWLEDNCGHSEASGFKIGETAFATLYANYRAWCGNNGCQPLSAKQYGNRLTALELPSINAAGGKRRPLTLKVGA